MLQSLLVVQKDNANFSVATEETDLALGECNNIIREILCNPGGVNTMYQILNANGYEHVAEKLSMTYYTDLSDVMTFHQPYKSFSKVHLFPVCIHQFNKAFLVAKVLSC